MLRLYTVKRKNIIHVFINKLFELSDDIIIAKKLTKWILTCLQNKIKQYFKLKAINKKPMQLNAEWLNENCICSS